MRGLDDETGAPVPAHATHPALPWIACSPDAPYFVTEHGESWTPIGHNDAITWPELAGLFRRRDLPAVERHLRWLKAHGVTCLRLMREYAQGEHRYLERPVGRFQPNMVRLWDDLFALLEKVGLHVLLTPFDTFFLWTRWSRHPYRSHNGGPCASRRKLLRCPETREAIRRRLAFASDRWGGSPALFAWDLWNEVNPALAADDPVAVNAFVDDIGPWLRAREIARYGRAHPQTVSIFWRDFTQHPSMGDVIFRHPALDFVNIHLYELGTIDDPRDTVAPALAVGRLMRQALAEAAGGRPVFDSEHGPIHAFLDHRRTLSEPFDDEYFRHIQWAHLASGGAGGGMRWPNRHPHVLTPGMRAAQRSLAAFLPLVDWSRFRRRNLTDEVRGASPDVACFACGDENQAVAWLLRTGAPRRNDGMRPAVDASPVAVSLPGFAPGSYRVTCFDTVRGTIVGNFAIEHMAELLQFAVPLANDLALTVRRDLA
jgi:mannan endo-1,4-beta-mannosidase